MKLLYIAPLQIDFDKLDGVSKKILWQVGALQKNHFDTDILYYFGGRVCLYHPAGAEREQTSEYLGSAHSRIDVIKAAKALAGAREYDAVYVRYPFSDPFFLDTLKTLKARGATVVVELPTYPYGTGKGKSLKEMIVLAVDGCCRTRLRKYVKRIVTYADYEEIWGIKTIRASNGINFDEIALDREPIDCLSRIDLIAVAAMYLTHGYERIIEGMRHYYQNGGKRNVHLKLVGDGSETPKYKVLVEQYGLGDHVTFYGSKFGNELDEIYRCNAVGVDSLALHRRKKKRASTLKTREYAAKGLPVLASSYIDAFSKEGNDNYVFRVPCDDSAVDMEGLIAFVDRLYLAEENGRTVNRTAALREKIRQDGKGTCDILITMQPIIDELLC